MKIIFVLLNLFLSPLAFAGQQISGNLSVSGNVGIGTTSPSNTLEVNGTSKIDTGLIVPLIYPASDSTTAIQIDKANGSTNVLDVDTTNGRIGIGTTSPSQLLSVNGNINYTGRIIKRVTTYSSATSITPNSDTDDISYMANTQGAGTFTVNADSGANQVNGQSWVLKISSTAVQTFSWNSIFNGGSLGLPTSTLGTSTVEYFYFVWDSVSSKWDYSGNVGGF